MTMLGPSLINVIIAIAISRLPNTNRVIRSAVLSARESLYVEASRALGCSNWRIMLRHLLPNVTAPMGIRLRRDNCNTTVVTQKHPEWPPLES